MRGSVDPACVVAGDATPVRPPDAVPTTVWMIPTVALVVNVTVATPDPLVALVLVPNEPPLPVLSLHVITTPARATGVPVAVTNCAVTVTPLPTAGMYVLRLIRNCVPTLLGK